MSVVYKPPREHHCGPGWTWTFREDGPAGPGRYGSPPTIYDYPRGTVWACECGQHWVSQGHFESSWLTLMEPVWRRESWWERRKRLKRAAQSAEEGR